LTKFENNLIFLNKISQIFLLATKLFCGQKSLIQTKFNIREGSGLEFSPWRVRFCIRLVHFPKYKNY